MVEKKKVIEFIRGWIDFLKIRIVTRHRVGTLKLQETSMDILSVSETSGWGPMKIKLSCQPTLTVLTGKRKH